LDFDPVAYLIPKSNQIGTFGDAEVVPEPGEVAAFVERSWCRVASAGFPARSRGLNCCVGNLKCAIRAGFRSGEVIKIVEQFVEPNPQGTAVVTPLNR
jgi:hypothetical protein